MTTRQSVIIQLGLLLLIALLGSLLSPSCVTEREKQKALELKQLAGEIAPYPQAKVTGDKVVYKTEVVYFFTYYESPDNFNQVREFYDQQLKAKGWTRVESPPSILVGPPDWRRYRKGDYAIVVERDDNGQRDYFDVTFEWNPGQE